MNQRWSRLPVLLLVAVVVVSGLVGCSRQAEVREVPETEPAGTEAVALQPTESAEVIATPGPKETVVSALTAAPEGATPGPEPTLAETAAEPGNDTPAAAEETETVGAPAPTTSTADEGQWIVHRVKKGETLSLIATRYGVSVRAIRKANNMGNSNIIKVGQKLKIPTQGSTLGATATPGCRARHTVKRGETLSAIAAQYDATTEAVMTANNLTRNTADTLNPGQVLCIP